jgi:hypothetical protein
MQPQDGYARKQVMLEERLLIESVCSICGFKIVDSATEKLQEREEEHRNSCPMTSTAA